MIKWTVIIAVALMLWIAEYKQELNGIMSEMKLPKGEKEENEKVNKPIRVQKEGHRGLHKEHDR